MTHAEAPPPTRSPRRRMLRNALTTVAVGTQTVLLYVGCWFSISMDEFGCARSDPGFEPHGADPVHGLTGFVFGVSACCTLIAALTRHWLVVAAEVAFMVLCAYFLSSHPNDPNWCRAS